MPTATYLSEVGRYAGGYGGEGLIWQTSDYNNAIWWMSPSGDLFVVGRDSSGTRYNGYVAFDVSDLLNTPIIVRSIDLHLYFYFSPMAQSSPAPSFTSGPEFEFDLAWNIFTQTIALSELHDCEGASGAITVHDTPPSSPSGGAEIVFSMPTTWFNPSKVISGTLRLDAEIEDSSVYASGWRYYIFAAGYSFPAYKPKLVIDYDIPAPLKYTPHAGN